MLLSRRQGVDDAYDHFAFLAALGRLVVIAADIVVRRGIEAPDHLVGWPRFQRRKADVAQRSDGIGLRIADGIEPVALFP